MEPTDNRDTSTLSAERQVHELETTIDQVFQSLAVTIVIDPECGAIVAANDAALDFYGYTAEEIQDVTVTDINTLSPLEVHREMQQAVEDGRRFFEFRHRLSTGEVRDVDVYTRPVQWNGTTCLYSIVHDVSQRVRTQEELARESSRLQGFLTGTDVGTWEWNVQTGECVFNDRWAQICGYELAELEPVGIGTWGRLAHPDDLARSGDLLQQHFDGESPRYDVECRMRHKDGHWVWVRDSGKVMSWTEDGKPLLMMGTHADITYAKRSEEQLRRSLSLVDEAEELAHFGGWHLDLDECRLEWTKGACRILGVEPDDAPATYAAFLGLVHPEDRAMVDSAFASSLGGASPGYEIEHRIVRPNDGVERVVVERCAHERSAKGRVVRSVGTVQDITERKDREANERRLEEQVQHAQKLESLGVLAGGIAHDFNNILAAILGHAEFAALALNDGHPAQQSVARILDGVNRARDLTQQMLSYSGRTVVDMCPRDLTKLVDGLSDLLRAAVPNSVVLQRVLENSVPLILADGAQLQQVVMNLITNAAEAIGDGQGTVTITTGITHRGERGSDQEILFSPGGDHPAPSDYVFLEVSDTGCGMDRDTANRIFEPFFTTKFHGRGLGMAAVLGIVGQHRGFVTIRTAPGKGSTFRVHFPPCASSGESDDPGSGDESMSGRIAKVLVADDETEVRETFVLALRQFGFEALGVGDGLEAVEACDAATEPFDCVVLDLTMPRMSGPECFAILRENHPDLPIVVASGFSVETVEEALGHPGPNGFLAKPFSLDTLREAVVAAIAETTVAS